MVVSHSDSCSAGIAGLVCLGIVFVMMYSRREFLRCMAAGGIVTATGLWFPGEKLISIPKRTGNTLVSIDMITREALRVLHEKLYFFGETSRQTAEWPRLDDPGSFCSSTIKFR